MKNNKIFSIVLIVVIVLGLVTYLLYFKNKNASSVNEPVTPVTDSVVYDNTEYGFTFSLPGSWRGYSVIKNTWDSNPLVATSTKQAGPKLLIRNPAWTSNDPYQDIPILVFTLAQWNSYIAEDFTVSAAPIQASELARNNLYVFALPPRWDFEYNKGYEEAQNIVKSNPIKAYLIQAGLGNNKLPVFVWRYAKASSLNLDGQPKTNIFIGVTYPNGTVQEKLVATTDGGCNDLPDSKEDRVPNSTVAQCYYAGLGYSFKITKGTKSYLVQRKTFEESLPGNTPSKYEYKTILELPISI